MEHPPTLVDCKSGQWKLCIFGSQISCRGAWTLTEELNSGCLQWPEPLFSTEAYTLLLSCPGLLCLHCALMLCSFLKEGFLISVSFVLLLEEVQLSNHFFSSAKHGWNGLPMLLSSYYFVYPVDWKQTMTFHCGWIGKHRKQPRQQMLNSTYIGLCVI